jgi:hypothetical protein
MNLCWLQYKYGDTNRKAGNQQQLGQKVKPEHWHEMKQLGVHVDTIQAAQATGSSSAWQATQAHSIMPASITCISQHQRCTNTFTWTVALAQNTVISITCYTTMLM